MLETILNSIGISNVLTTTLWMILLFPLGAFVIQTAVGRRLPRGGDWVSMGAIFISFALSILIFVDVLMAGNPQFRETFSWAWISLPGFVLNFGFLVDNVTSLMLVVVTTVSLLVHVYSMGYMKDDRRYFRYYGYLSLFSFSMLGLVLVDNLFGLYIFWELVGLSSYLLIGFWFEKPSAAKASKKAFIVNRVGDVGFFIGIMIIFFETNGLFNYQEIFSFVAKGNFSSEVFGISLLTLAGIALFLGAVGKSAQFPLHIWLPDAMEGPTPVSALIHAATMVAAGVYMITRLFVFFSPDALLVIAYTGAFTAIFAATLALTHNDIKKVLAYSTVSQLGYMVMALGVGAYTAGFFHLVTHAAFKACLFLCAGSVIHALHTQDLRKMGGLRKKAPITFATMLIATLAISGVPFFSGFVSKDMILAGTLSFASANPIHALIPIFGFLAAGLTAFYMFRLIFMTFYGAPREPERLQKAHESPWSMTLPLIILSTLSLAVVFTGSFTGLGEIHLFGPWFEQLIQKPTLGAYKFTGVNIAPLVEKSAHMAHAAGHQAALILSLSAAFLGILLAYLMYFIKVLSPERIAQNCQGIYRALTHLYWIDDFYEWAILRNQVRLNNWLANFDNRIIDRILVDGWASITTKTSTASGDFDNRVIDETLVDGTGRVVARSGKQIRKIQTGQIQQYLLTGLGALVTILILYLIL